VTDLRNERLFPSFLNENLNFKHLYKKTVTKPNDHNSSPLFKGPSLKSVLFNSKPNILEREREREKEDLRHLTKLSKSSVIDFSKVLQIPTLSFFLYSWFSLFIYILNCKISLKELRPICLIG
jgi:hypothetical protein